MRLCEIHEGIVSGAYVEDSGGVPFHPSGFRIDRVITWSTISAKKLSSS